MPTAGLGQVNSTGRVSYAPGYAAQGNMIASNGYAGAQACSGGYAGACNGSVYAGAQACTGSYAGQSGAAVPYAGAGGNPYAGAYGPMMGNMSPGGCGYGGAASPMPGGVGQNTCGWQQNLQQPMIQPMEFKFVKENVQSPGCGQRSLDSLPMPEGTQNFSVGGSVEVWSNSYRTWCRGTVEHVDNGMVTARFYTPDGARGSKTLPDGLQNSASHQTMIFHLLHHTLHMDILFLLMPRKTQWTLQRGRRELPN